MKGSLTFCIFLLLNGMITLSAQNDYIVKTQNLPNNTVLSEEEEFVIDNFPLRKLCEWKAGMKFMVIPEKLDMIIPTFQDYNTHKDISNSELKYKIFEFTGTEENEKALCFIFECENKKYSYEVKFKSLDIYCREKPEADIRTLAYLGDVDKAKEILVDRILYTKTPIVKIDDANAFNGYKEVKLPYNTKVTVTAVGVGDKICPVKIIFKDEKNNSYYWETAFSKTNAGIDTKEFTANRKYDYFPNAFSFSDAEIVEADKLMRAYGHKVIYPKIPVETERGEKIDRYTPLTITDIQKSGTNRYYFLILKDMRGRTYRKEVTFSDNLLLKTPNYFNDLFVVENIREKYPYIIEAHWKLISKGEVINGMTREECKLALGEPNLIRTRGNKDEYEDWIYQNRVLNFVKGKLNIKNQ